MLEPRAEPGYRCVCGGEEEEEPCRPPAGSSCAGGDGELCSGSPGTAAPGSDVPHTHTHRHTHTHTHTHTDIHMQNHTPQGRIHRDINTITHTHTHTHTHTQSHSTRYGSPHTHTHTHTHTQIDNLEKWETLWITVKRNFFCVEEFCLTMSDC